jgi:hypothetical protein
MNVSDFRFALKSFVPDLKFLVFDDLKSATSEQTLLRIEIAALNSGPFLESGFLKAHQKYYQKGYQVRRSCKDYIFSQIKEMMEKDQGLLNEYKDDVMKIIARIEKDMDEADFDPYKGKFLF